MEKNLAVAVNTVAWLTSVGIVPVENPTWARMFEGVRGSCANYKKVTLGEIAPVKDPLGEEHLAVLVRYEAERESGEDLCDFYKAERRYVKVADLKQYLEEKGWR